MKFRVALAQTNPVLFDKEANLKIAEQYIRQASLTHVDFVVFPECHLSGYYLEDRVGEMAEPLRGVCMSRLAEMARMHNIAVMMGFVESNPSGGKPFDSLGVITRRGEMVGVYRKIHLYNQEKDWFTAGTGVRVFPTDYAPVGVLICYDVEFPEGPRILALRGAQWIVVSTATMLPNQHSYRVFQMARALENRLWIVSVNRVGNEGPFKFFGQSGVCDPTGQLVLQAGDGEGLFVVEIDLDANISAKKADTDYLADRKPEAYGDLVKT